jgi:glycosyltransferase involved in cell wall biosynthesis
VSILWYVVGFSLAFGDSIGGIIGNPLSFAFFNNVGTAAHPSMATSIPFILFAAFQLKFAIITPALITGSFAERVRFLGFQSDPAAAYRSADVAALASRAESLSNFLIEAQSHGLPVVATDVGGVNECCLPGLTGDIVAPGDNAALAAALSRWLGDPSLRQTAAPLARRFAREAFDPARQAAAYLALFNRLHAANLSRPARPSGNGPAKNLLFPSPRTPR